MSNLEEQLAHAEGLLDSDRPQEAEQLLRQIAEDYPDNHFAAHLLGRAFFDLDRIAESAEALQKAVFLSPENARYLGSLATVLLRTGRFTEAEALLRKSLQLDPNRIGSYFDLIYSRRVGPEDQPLIHRLEQVLRNADIDARARAHGEYSLGKAYDDLGEYQKAMAHYDQANAAAKRGRQFNFDVVERSFLAIQQTFTRDFIAAQGNLGNPTKQPILIVGMMRSGTTLVEQILSAHPNVHGGGELPFWMQNRAKVFDQKGSFLPAELADIAAKYLRLLEQRGGGKSRVTDKMPQNFLVLGMFHLAFPHATIIHCTRNPVDTCLSVYFTPNDTAPPFLHEKEFIAKFYRLYANLMDHWRLVLPKNRILEVSYEQLVGQREIAARRILGACGLEWNDAVSRHEENARNIATASLWQARQPIYKTSVNRWRNYEPWLGPLAELL